MNLSKLGFYPELTEQAEGLLKENFQIARVALEHTHIYKVLTDEKEYLAEITGKMRHLAHAREDYPVVGDWVIIEPLPNEDRAIIHHVLPRFSKFSRKVAGGEVGEQIVAANINTLFLVMALNHDFNVRRIERYLVMAWESGANPVIILTKKDLCDDVEKKIEEAEAAALGVPIHATAALQDEGLEAFAQYLTEGQTAALVGSSGAGKSTLTNRLYGEEKQLVKEIRADDGRGRHTTTHRELIMLPSGGVIIDTPGMRELQLWETGGSIDHSFSDIQLLAADCKFRDCRHEQEPGCKIQEALEDGKLSEERWQSYLKLQREAAYLERKTNKQAQLKEREKWKKIAGDRTRTHRK